MDETVGRREVGCIGGQVRSSAYPLINGALFEKIMDLRHCGARKTLN